MPAKRPTQRRTGRGAARSTVAALEAEGGEASVEVAPALGFLPADPEDARLTLAGLVVGGDDKVDLAAYDDLKAAYAQEPPPDKHPDPEHPGVRHGERVPKGLRVWDDIRAGATSKDGAGWVAVRSATASEKKKEKWFNIRMCGSWRMAFLLARLQRQHWDAHAAWLKEPIASNAASATALALATTLPSPASPAAALPLAASPTLASSSAVKGEAGEKAPPVATPKAKRARPAADGKAAESKEGQKRARQTAQPAVGESKKEQVMQKTPPGVKAEVLANIASNPRLQAILAAHQEKLKQVPSVVVAS